MTFSERHLYHAIHPAKMFADVVAVIGAPLLLFNGEAVLGAAFAIGIPASASFAIWRRADLNRLRASWMGRYVRRYMTLFSRIQCVGGYAMLMGSAWSHSFLGVVMGASLIIHAWAHGLLVPRSAMR